MKLLAKKLLLGLLCGLLCAPMASSAYTPRAVRLANKAAEKASAAAKQANTARLMGRGKRTVTPLPEWRPGLDTVTRKPIPGYKPKPQPAGPRLIEGKITSPTKYEDMVQGSDGVWRQRGSYRSWTGAGAAGAAVAGGGASYWWYNRETGKMEQAPVVSTVAGSGLGEEPKPGTSTEVTELSVRPISEYMGTSVTVEDLRAERAALSADLAQERDPFMQQELESQIKALDNSIRRVHFATEKIDPNSWRASAWDARRSLGNARSTIGARMEQLRASGSGLWNRPAAAIIAREEKATETAVDSPANTPEDTVALLEREKTLEERLAGAGLEVASEPTEEPAWPTREEFGALSPEEQAVIRRKAQEKAQEEAQAAWDNQLVEKYSKKVGRQVSLPAARQMAEVEYKARAERIFNRLDSGTLKEMRLELKQTGYPNITLQQTREIFKQKLVKALPSFERDALEFYPQLSTQDVDNMVIQRYQSAPEERKRQAGMSPSPAPLAEQPTSGAATPEQARVIGTSNLEATVAGQ